MFVVKIVELAVIFFINTFGFVENDLDYLKAGQCFSNNKMVVQHNIDRGFIFFFYPAVLNKMPSTWAYNKKF